MTEINDNDILEHTPHIIYVHAEDPDESTVLGQLMHDFKCNHPEDMYDKTLATRMEQVKTSPQEVRVMAEFRNEYEEAAFKRGEERGLVKTAMNMLIKKFSGADILDIIGNQKALDEAKRRLKLC